MRGSLSSIRSKKAVLTGDEVVTYITIPPDGGWGWVITFVSFLLIMVGDGSVNTYSLFKKQIQQALNCSNSGVMLPSSFMTGVYYLCGPLGCAMVNKLGFRKTAIFGCFLAVVAFVASSYINNLALFIFVYGLIGGTGFSLTYSCAILAVGFYFEKWRALATSLFVSGSSVGTMTFPIIFSRLMNDFHWTFKFKIVALFNVVVGILCFAFKPLKPVKVVSKDPGKSNRPLTTILSFESIGEFEDEDENVKLMYPEYHNITYPTNAELHVKDPVIVDDKNVPNTSVTVRSKRSVRSRRSIKSVKKDMDTMSIKEKYSIIVVGDENYNCCHRLMWKIKAKICCCVMKETVPSRPMYRDDILFPHSLKHLPNYKKDKEKLDKDKKQKDIKYHMAVTRVTTQDDIEETVIPCVICPESVKRVLATMFDMVLIKNIPFAMINISAFLHMLGYYIPFLFFEQLVEETNATKSEVTLTLTILGIANLFGRMTCGIVSSLPQLNALVVSLVSLLITGGCLLIAPFYVNTIFAFCMVATFGFFGSCVLTLRSILLVDILGLEHLSNAFGLSMVFQGSAALIGIIVGGIMVDFFKKLSPVFVFAGSCIVISGILLIPVKKLPNNLKPPLTVPTPSTSGRK